MYIIEREGKKRKGTGGRALLALPQDHHIEKRGKEKLRSKISRGKKEIEFSVVNIFLV